MSGLLRVNIDAEGPLATGEWKQLLERYGTDATELVADEAAERIDSLASTEFRYRSSPRTGLYQKSIATEPTTQMPGIRVHVDRVVYGAWIEGVSSRNTSSRFKGYRLFRRTVDDVKSRVASIVASRTDRLVRELDQ